MHHTSLPAPLITMSEIIDQYKLLLFDAYGVLVRTEGAIEGAATLIENLNATQHNYFILTNDASRHITTSFERFNQLGLSIPLERIITSGSLLTRYFQERQLQGAKTVVLGPPDSHRYAQDAGAQLVKPWQLDHLDALVLGDLPTEEPIRWLEEATSALLRTLDAGKTPALVIPNPDLIYPKEPGRIGLTAGALCAMLERIIAERYPGQSLRFDRLGKPHHYIFEEGMVRAQHHDKPTTLMVGDQLVTDIQGAQDFGLSSALVQTGLVRLDHNPDAWPIKPTFILDALWSP